LSVERRGVRLFRCSGVRLFRCSGVRVFRCSGVRVGAGARRAAARQNAKARRAARTRKGDRGATVPLRRFRPVLTGIPDGHGEGAKDEGSRGRRGWRRPPVAPRCGRRPRVLAGGRGPRPAAGRGGRPCSRPDAWPDLAGSGRIWPLSDGGGAAAGPVRSVSDMARGWLRGRCGGLVLVRERASGDGFVRGCIAVAVGRRGTGRGCGGSVRIPPSTSEPYGSMGVLGALEFEAGDLSHREPATGVRTPCERSDRHFGFSYRD
jgi:hypothetical protein